MHPPTYFGDLSFRSNAQQSLIVLPENPIGV
jgi:hypothetical protein